MKFKESLFRQYVALAPLPLALERLIECEILMQHPFERPILDIGCGDGLFAHLLFDEPIDVGIDLDPAEIARARSYGAYTELIACPGSAIPKPEGMFRTIMSNSVLEHIPDVEPVFREAFRLLAPGGRFYITVPSDLFDNYSAGSRILRFLRLNGLDRAFRKRYNAFWKHFHVHSPEEWAGMAEAAGFRVEEVFRYGPPRVCTTHDLMVPLAVPSYFTKKLLDRWTLCPSLRSALYGPFMGRLRRWVAGAGRCDNGGLVFMALGKA